MKKMILLGALSISILTIAFTSCVKQKFDSPPDLSTYDPNLTVNATLKQVKSLYNGSTPTLIDSDYTIAAYVIADDRSGSFYKQIVVQDSTAGIVVLLGRSGLYTDYPIGRKLYIHCKGLYLGAYGKFMQLGYTPDNTNALSDIPAAVIGKHVVKANTGNTIVPIKVNIADLKSLNPDLMGRLIQIDSAEFVANDVNQPYAQDPNIASGTDRTIEDCAGDNMVVRMSGYANFRNELIPAGKGPITAVFSRYNSTAQLLIRDTFDIRMNNTRCGGVIITPPVDITIDSLRKMYPDTSSTQNIVLGNQMIHGTVISSYADSNISQATSFYIQDESGRGINVYGISGLALGDSVTIKLSGNLLIVYNGALEVKKGTGATLAATKISGGKTVTPVMLSIADLNADLNNPLFKARKYESVLVKLSAVTITGSGFFAGNNTLNDGTGTIIMYTRNTIPFTTTPTPTTPVNITGIGIKYKTTPEIYIRKVSLDVQ